MEHISPLKAIRKHCLTCSKRPKDVRLCSTSDCYLFPFRMGHNPARKRIGRLKSVTRSTLESITPNSMTNSDEIKAKTSYAMSKSISPNQVASGKEIRLLKMEAQGRIQICREGKEILIKVTTEG